MIRISVLIKNNMKLLLRNKGFLPLLFIIPLLSLFILNIKDESLTNYDENSTQTINELDDEDTKIVYSTDMSYYSVKVFDSSNSKLTDFLLQRLVDTGMFSISRFHSEHMTDKEISNMAEENADNDRIGTVLYVNKNFEQEVLQGDIKDSMQIYSITEDERGILFEKSLEQELAVVLQQAKVANGDKNQLKVILSEMDKKLPQKIIQKISSGEKIMLNSKEKAAKERIGFSIAIVSLGFIFGGVFIAYTVIEERNNKVYTRITLSKTSRYEYMISKLVVSVLVSALQTVIIWIGLSLFVRSDFGISRISYLFLVFLLGLVFHTLSLSVGVIIGNAMEANYAVFSIWCLTSLLSGLYFSIDNASGLFKKLSYLMPQKWFLRGAEMLMTGDRSAYLMVISVTAAFLIVTISVGAAGLKLKLEE